MAASSVVTVAEVCQICEDALLNVDVEAGETILTLPCGHQYHSLCHADSGVEGCLVCLAAAAKQAKIQVPKAKAKSTALTKLKDKTRQPRDGPFFRVPVVSRSVRALRNSVSGVRLFSLWGGFFRALVCVVPSFFVRRGSLFCLVYQRSSL